MPNARIRTILLAVAISSAASVNCFANLDEYSGRVMYKYTKDDGTTVMDFSLDTAAAKKGYSILTPTGRVIAIVPPELTEQERKLKEIEKEQKVRDKFLLSRYSSVADVESARDREVGDLQSRVSALQGNLMSVKTNLEQQQSQAADRERRGQQPTPAQAQTITDLTKKIETIKNDISVKQKEVDVVRVQYEKDIERFHVIQEKYKAVLDRRSERENRPGS